MADHNRRAQYLITLSVSLSTVAMGLQSGWATPVVPKLLGNQTDVDINKHQMSTVLALSPLGFVFGTLVTKFVSEKFGRRYTLLCGALPMTAGTIILLFAKKAWLLYMMRLLWDTGSGMISTTLTIYMAEISDKEIRGTLSLATRITFNLGTLLMMVVGPLVSFQTISWMLLFFPATFFLACWWIPESPYALLKDGKVDKARKVIKKLRGYKDMELLEKDLTQLQSDVSNEMRHSGSLKELLTEPRYRRAIVIVAGLKFASIMSGTLTIQQYMGVIIEDAKPGMSLATSVIMFGVIRFVVAIMSSALADRVGRRPLLIYSFFGTAVSLVIVGTYFFFKEVLQETASLRPFAIIVFIGIVASNVISTVGFNSIMGVIQGEVFPLNVKVIATVVLNILGAAFGAGVAKGYQLMKDYTGLFGVFWMFALVALCGAFFSLIVMPETKGKSLAEIQRMLQGKYYEESGLEVEMKNLKANGKLLGNGSDNSKEMGAKDKMIDGVGNNSKLLKDGGKNGKSMHEEGDD